MQVKPASGENEQEFIGRCMSEEKESFPDLAQRYAVCKSKWDTENMSAVKMNIDEVKASRDSFMKHIKIK